jgi:hypothetical protein
MVNQRRPKLPQCLKPHIWVTYESGTILIRILRSRCYDREAIVGRSHACSLHVPPEDVVDETRFTGRVVPNEKDKGE